jgi:hypothetical protein
MGAAVQSSGLMGAALRRWYVTLLGLAVTAGLCLAAVHFVPAKYEATARVLLLPPASAVGKGGNPYLQLGGLDTVAAILGRSVSDPQTVAALAQRGATGKYTFAPDLLTSGPVLLLTVDDATPGAALGSAGIVLSEVPSSLSELQRSANVPTSALITSSVLTQDQQAKVVRKTQIRALLVAAAGGVGFTLVLVAMVDAFLRRRRDRRLGRQGETAPDPEPKHRSAVPDESEVQPLPLPYLVLHGAERPSSSDEATNAHD